MVFKYRPYEDIMKGTANEAEISNEDGFKDTRSSLRGKHDKEASVELHQPRRHQVQWIERSNEHLQGDDETKAETITALMFLQMCEIATGYKESIFDAVKENSATRHGGLFNGSGSIYFRGLQKNIGISAKNSIDEEDVLKMLANAQAFIEKHFYVDGDSRQGVRFKDDRKQNTDDHIFKDIEGLNIFYYLGILHQVQFEARNRINKRNEQRLTTSLSEVEAYNQEQARLVQSSSGFLSYFWTSSSPAKQSIIAPPNAPADANPDTHGPGCPG